MQHSVYAQVDISALLSGFHSEPATDTTVRHSPAVSRDAEEQGPTAYLQKGTEPGAKSPFQIFKHWRARRITLTPFCITHTIALRNLRKPGTRQHS